MPCNSDHMESSHEERFASLVFSLLDELDGKKFNHKKASRGYDSRAYNKVSKIDLDMLVAKLCGKLMGMTVEEIHSSSLELQMWWRDHQAADKKRKKTEKKNQKENREKKMALGKLTDREKNLLGLK